MFNRYFQNSVISLGAFIALIFKVNIIVILAFVFLFWNFETKGL